MYALNLGHRLARQLCLHFQVPQDTAFRRTRDPADRREPVRCPAAGETVKGVGQIEQDFLRFLKPLTRWRAALALFQFSKSRPEILNPPLQPLEIALFQVQKDCQAKQSLVEGVKRSENCLEKLKMSDRKCSTELRDYR